MGDSDRDVEKVDTVERSHFRSGGSEVVSIPPFWQRVAHWLTEPRWEVSLVRDGYDYKIVIEKIRESEGE